MTRVALVTSGVRGIGRAIALDLSRDHRVAVTSRDVSDAALPGNIAALQADFTNPDSFGCVIAETLRQLGRLDVIVNNAGVVAPTPKDGFDGVAAQQILDVNLLVPAGLLAAALPYLKPGASVVNISSVNAELPPKDASIYGASKAALNLWTRAMAKELGARGIRVNAVAPGAINGPDSPRPPALTRLFVEQTALGRIGTPEDVARAVRFLAGDDAGFITGEVLTVSGGYRL